MELEVARVHRLEVGLSSLPNNVLHCASANYVVPARKFHPVGPADVVVEYLSTGPGHNRHAPVTGGIHFTTKSR